MIKGSFFPPFFLSVLYEFLVTWKKWTRFSKICAFCGNEFSTYGITVITWMQNCIFQLSCKRKALNIFQVQQSLNSTKNVDSGLQRYIKNITILLRQFISFPYMLLGIFAYLVFLWEMGG